MSIWHRIKHTNVKNYHDKEFPCEVKRHDVILTNPEKEDSEQGEDELKEVNLGTIKEPRPTFISASLSSEEEGKYMSLLKEYKDIFAWLYKEMPRLDPKIEVDVNKLIEVGFIREVKYPSWIANIVPVKKKNEQLRVCVDFRDLNNACPKDDFSLPIAEVMVDEEMTAFRTPKGIYCYKLMPFRLKNVGATYQRVMQKVFEDMLHKYVECYVDDLVVKSKRRKDHLKDLKFVFDRLRKYQLRKNPLKCAFSVTSGMFLGIIERSLNTLLAQEEEKGKERALYHLSRTLVGTEVNYSHIEKMCLALFFAIDKLRYYIQAFIVHLVAKADPIKYVLSRSINSGCLIKWAVLLQQYDIVYISQKAIKGKALAYFLAHYQIPSDWKLCEDLPDDEVFFTKVIEPRTMYFDGVAQKSGAGALIIGLQMALEIGVSLIETYGDLKLIINQLSLQYDVKHEDLKPYFAYARQLMERFDTVMLEHVPRIENKRADTLKNLATVLMMPDNVALNILLCQRWIMPPIFPECQKANVTTSHLIDEED
ncbi:uncharacterized protein E5676_scaffold704G00030 [Cucumis melo var. makuwa]|uniref:RNase H type-1 domain-containing protein n=1 Tax=Cucumis melo var. makuwa TaxID=1194695 RepID=A0A5A7UVS2_CUCMM|nr:uncharacterized protein E6C27_scaffold126G00080 [Cucumis melo var. makuwa]TYJ97446.1 uncharacterized protein E5676_scaffold704G00030 [Cucumis melo var. makuwa]